MSSDRLGRAQEELLRAGVDALVVGPSADLRYLTGYDAPAFERLTLLVLPAASPPAIVVPELEHARAQSGGVVAEIRTWGETDDPFAAVHALLGDPARVAVGERLWAGFLLRLQETFPRARFVSASPVMRALRVRKDPAEIGALRRSAAAADRVAALLADEKVSGRTEREVARWISEALVDAGCERASFAIVASGPNASSPHHEPGSRVIGDGDALVCDFGGTLDGYCSDITRTFAVSRVPAELDELYRVLRRAQEVAVAAVAPGVAAEAVDRAARSVIAEAGYGEFFIHRTGHGIGLEVHEEPYLVAGNAEPLEPGMAFSVEPGIYLPGRCGARIEDIVVVAGDGAERLNLAPRELVVVA